MRQRPIIAKTFYVAIKCLWREHNMVSDFEVTYSCYVFLVVFLTQGLVTLPTLSY